MSKPDTKNPLVRRVRMELKNSIHAMTILCLLAGFMAGAIVERSPTMQIHLDWLTYVLFAMTLVGAGLLLRSHKKLLDQALPDEE